MPWFWWPTWVTGWLLVRVSDSRPGLAHDAYCWKPALCIWYLCIIMVFEWQVLPRNLCSMRKRDSETWTGKSCAGRPLSCNTHCKKQNIIDGKGSPSSDHSPTMPHRICRRKVVNRRMALTDLMLTWSTNPIWTMKSSMPTIGHRIFFQRKSGSLCWKRYGERFLLLFGWLAVGSKSFVLFVVLSIVLTLML